eukprot:GHVL01035869.1.p1 GENE.GHVL01035869.1~~GHVL01035869.1.p1  ORF type:complete len:610 (+),score=64.16 GHVL01035869.1:44-1831(+)
MKFMFFVLIDMVIIINGVLRQRVTKAAPMEDAPMANRKRGHRNHGRWHQGKSQHARMPWRKRLKIKQERKKGSMPVSNNETPDLLYLASPAVIFDNIEFEKLLIGTVLPLLHPNLYLQLFPLSFPLPHDRALTQCTKIHEQMLPNISFERLMQLLENNELSFNQTKHFTLNLKAEVNALKALSSSQNREIPRKFQYSYNIATKLLQIFRKAVNFKKFTKDDLVGFSKDTNPVYMKNLKRMGIRAQFEKYGFVDIFEEFWSKHRQKIFNKFNEMADKIKEDRLWNHSVKLNNVLEVGTRWKLENTIKCLTNPDDFKKRLHDFDLIISNIRTEQEKIDEIDRVAKLELMFKVPQEMLAHLVRYYDYINEDYDKMMQWSKLNFEDAQTRGYLINDTSSLTLNDVLKFCVENHDSELCLQVSEDLDGDVNSHWKSIMKNKLRFHDNLIEWVAFNWETPANMWEYQLQNRDTFYYLRQSLTLDLDTLKAELKKIEGKMSEMMSHEEFELWEDKKRFCQHRQKQYSQMDKHLRHSTLFVSNLDYLINRKSLTYFPFLKKGCTAEETGFAVFSLDDDSQFQLPHSGIMDDSQFQLPHSGIMN